MPILANAQAGIQYWNTEHGLSNNIISQIHQDQEGYIWLATQYGLNRFDGYEFQQYRYRPNDSTGLSSNWVRAVTQDSSKQIWLATDYGGIHALDPITGNAIRYPLIKNNGSELNNVSTVYCARDQSVWVGTRDGLFRKQADEKYFQQVEIFLEDQPIERKSALFHQIQEDSDGNIYLLTNLHIYQFDVTKETFRTIFSFPKRTLKRIYVDRAGQLWGLTKNQLLQFRADNGTWTSKVYYEDNFNIGELFFNASMHEDHLSQLWIATNYGVLVLDKKTRQTKRITKNQLFPTDVKSASILCFYEDRHKNMWMGTSNGLLLQSPFGKRFQAQQRIPFLEQFDEVRAVEQVGDKLYISNLEGIFVLDLIQKNAPPKKISDAVVYDFLLASSGYLYAAGHSFHRIQVSTMEFESFNLKARAWSLAEDQKGNIWIASIFSSLQRFHPKTKTFSSYDTKDIPTLNHNSSTGLLLDSKDRLWTLSLLSGVYVLENASSLGDQAIPTFLNFNYDENDPKSLSNSLAIAITEDLNGDIWVGTDGGLNRIDGQDYSIKRYLQEDGLKDEKVMGLLVDKNGNIWGSTIGHGIFRLNPLTEEFTFFNRKDGLVNDNFLTLSAYQNKAGLLFFGSSETLQVIDPKSIEAIQKPNIQFLFTRCSTAKDNKDIGLAERTSIELPYDYQSLNIHYTTLNFYQAAKTEYYYKIEELHDDWQPNRNDRSLTFTALAPDQYTLKVKAVNPDLQFNQAIIQLNFLIHPPWWQSTWACLSYLLIGMIGLYTFYQFQLKQQLKKAETQRLQELDHLKTRLYTNITHEFRTPLTVISGMADQVRNNPKDWSQKGAEMIKRNSEQLLHLVNQMLELSKLEAGNSPVNWKQQDIVVYLKYLTEAFHALAISKNIAIHFKAHIAELWMDMDAEKIERIFTNLMSNALKFTPQNGQIVVAITQLEKANYCQISVADTGIGIATDHLPHIFDRFYQVQDATIRNTEGTGIGLALSKAFVQLLGGTIEVESELGKGTKFIVQLPIKRSAEQLSSIPHLQHPKNENASTLTLTTKPSATKELALLIEDHTDVLQYLKACLQEQYELVTAQDGAVGIEKALQLVPDIIISDVMMPEKDGFEVCTILKQDERTSHIPIILLTAKADEASRHRGLKTGADAYLVKPFDRAELEIRLQQLIELRQRLKAKYGAVELKQIDVQKEQDPELLFLKKLENVILEQLSNENFRVEPDLCQAMLMSRPQLYRKLKALKNVSPSTFIRTIRLREARRLLQTGQWNVGDVVEKVGFKDHSYFTKVYTATFGEMPSEIKR